MLRLEGIAKKFGDKRAVDAVSLVVPAGQLVGVIGRSGAGKSTLLRMINRLTEPSEGSIRYGDLDITALRGRALREWRARCAMIFQQFNLAGRLDVARNYCDRLVGLANGRVVFDGVPSELTDRVSRDLYGLESDDVVGPEARPAYSPAAARPGLALAGS